MKFSARLVTLLLLAATLLAAGRGLAAEVLVWRAAQDRVDADISGWDLPRLLERIAEATGWEVYVEPGTQLPRPVSVRFQRLTTGQALDRLLGGVSYGLVPQSRGPDKLLVFRNSKDGATQPVRPRARAGADKRIPNELVVALKPRAKTNADELARQLGGKIIGRADKLGAYRLQFPDAATADAAREALLANDDARVDFNYSVPRPVEPSSAGAVQAAALSLKPGAGPDSSRFVVALVDTGVQSLGSPYKDFLLPSVSVASGSPDSGGLPTHGTAMAETILRGLDRVSPNAATPMRILPVDVYGSDNTTTTFEVAKGVAEAINGGASIVNLSLGSAGDSALLHSVIKEGFDRGVFFTAAAGNEPTTAPTFPAAYPEVLAVTARDRTGTVSSYANRGAFVDVAAPDTQVVSYGGNFYLVTGTSASTAYISGYAAGTALKDGAKPAAIAKQLIQLFPPVVK